MKAPDPGELAVIRLPDTVRSLAAVHGYLAPAALLIKPVAASPGDIVCRHRATVTINGRAVAQARTADESGRLLPGWSGCITLVPEQVFVLSAESGSFDGRYFGPLDRVHVLGSAHAVWVTKVDGHPTVPLRQRGPP